MKRLLIVEDSPEIASLMSLILRIEGNEVLTTSTGESALKMAARELPDLILLDVTLPGIDGFEVARQLKSAEETRAIKLIFVTSRNAVDDRVHGLEFGVDYIIKPFAVPELLARVRVALRPEH
ncbi:transcriptional activator protein CopR [Abditibacteriota bacterium]|nr:transcriptional activator protein CopR [Abditibacteriota bacterium]